MKKSEKFTPALFLENDGVWEGGSTSQFTPVMKFKLWERFSETGLEVAESMEVNGKRTYGYDVPILFKRAYRSISLTVSLFVYYKQQQSEFARIIKGKKPIYCNLSS